MVRPLRAFAWALAAALVAVPASAAVFTVHLKSGDSFESRYAPKDASWDAQKVVFLDEVGNLISVAKSDVDSIDADVESAGYGHMLNDTTMVLGRAPNDAPEPGSPEADRFARESAAAPAAAQPAEPIYEPNASPPTMTVIPPSSPGGTIYVEPAAPPPAPSEAPPPVQ